MPARKVKIIPASEKATHRGCAGEIRRLKQENPSLSKAEISRRVGCTWENTHSVLRNFLGKHSEPQLREYQQDKPDILDSIGYRIIGSLTDSKLQKASALQLVTAYGIIHDKRALLLGQATGINVNVVLDVIQAIKASERDK